MARQLAERELTSEGPRRGPDSGPKPRRRSVTVNLAESPLSWLHARGHLSDRLFDAGERLRADYEKAQLSPSVTMRWDPVRIKGGPDAGLSPTERQMAAKERFDGALATAGNLQPGTGNGTRPVIELPRCSGCGRIAEDWVPRCPGTSAWNGFARPSSARARPRGRRARRASRPRLR